jgi:hypothetical protein
MAKEGVMSEDDNTPEEEYVVTETPPEPEPEQAAEEAVGEQVEAAEEDEDEDDGDARLEASEDDEDDEPKAGRKPLTPEEKRAQRQNRKFRRRAAIEHKERELAFLRAENEEFKRRLQSVEQQTTQFNLSAMDQRLNETSNELETVNRIIAKAIEQGQGEDVAKALSIRDQLMERQRQLAEAKRQTESKPAEKPVKDPRIAAYAKEWISENSWYDPSGRDEDSAIVKVIDQRLAQEGYNPASEEYWIELNNRVAKRLPHKFQDEPMQESKPKAKRGGPPMATKREYAAPSSRKEVYISPERKQALIDAGVWDNPEERKRYIKRYAEYDRNSSSR